MAFEHLTFRYRWIARASKATSNFLMYLIPKMRTWESTKRLMKWNYKLMLKYGYFAKDEGFVEL